MATTKTETTKAPVTQAKENAVVTKPVAKKKFAPDEMIPCRSITPGEMFFEGDKSKSLYTWADADDVVEIEYRDLDYAYRSKNKMMFFPRFIVLNKDFVEQHDSLDDIYCGLYSASDLRKILAHPASQMKAEILGLPDGAKEALKHMASTMIDNGQLDSIKRIKVLDEVFETEMLVKVVE